MLLGSVLRLSWRFVVAAQGEGWGGIRPGFNVGGPACGRTALRCSQGSGDGELTAQALPAPFKQLRRVRARCTLRVPTSLLRASSTNKAPGRMPPQPFFRPARGMPRLIRACLRFGIWECHQQGDKSRGGAWMGALLASQARREGQVCPLLKARGWRACLSPKGELRSHLTWTARL
jgi:hypothetical protein